jgi:hypothetical protein
VGLDEDRAGQAQQRRRIRKDTNHVAMVSSCSRTWAASGWAKMVRIAAATISADPLGTWANTLYPQKMHPTSLPPIYCSKGLLFTRRRLAVVGNHSPWQLVDKR